MPTKPKTEKNIAQDLAKILSQHELTEIEYQTEGLTLRLVKSHVPVNAVYAAPAAAPAFQASVSEAAPVSSSKKEDGAPDYSKHPGVVKSPMVGVVYLAADPNSAPYVKEGDSVNEGQTLLLIEAMKTFNPLKAHKKGKVSKILVSSGMPVEYDAPLMIIE